MRLVVKIGSNIITAKDGLDEGRIRALAGDISRLFESGHEVAVVSSGAIAAGMGKLGIRKKPVEIKMKQAIAAAGQSSLMWAYEKAFSEKGIKAAQVLLTRDVFSDRARYINSKNTLITLLALKIVPIINENDTVAIEEIRFGDNDQLAALVASLIEAERLIILSDVEGLYNADPGKTHGAKLIDTVEEITPQMEEMAGGSGSLVGTGGMHSKLLAAKKAMESGILVNIINGRKPGLMNDLIEGRPQGTEFRPGRTRLSARKGWIAYGVKAKGRLILDEGASDALLHKGKSLLPSGILSVEGDFKSGDPVYCLTKSGERIAKGISNYSSEEIAKIKGKKTSQIEAVLGYRYSDEVIHRDNLVLVG
jgi:glutamate 5-kinase